MRAKRGGQIFTPQSLEENHLLTRSPATRLKQALVELSTGLKSAPQSSLNPYQSIAPVTIWSIYLNRVFCISCSEGICWRAVSLKLLGICGVIRRPLRTKRYRLAKMSFIFRRNVSHRFFNVGSSRHTTRQFVNCLPKAAKLFV